MNAGRPRRRRGPSICCALHLGAKIRLGSRNTETPNVDRPPIWKFDPLLLCASTRYLTLVIERHTAVVVLEFPCELAHGPRGVQIHVIALIAQHGLQQEVRVRA